jgi:TetR/AcrR family transcriptional regulator, transcriptional repressor for nem operon
VLAEVGASKGAFFHHCPSKAALGHALVERYAEADAAVLDAALTQAEATSDDPADQLVGLLRAFEDAATGTEPLQQPGCLFVSFVYEQIPDTDQIRPMITEAIELWRARILEKLEQAAAYGRVPAEVELSALADQVFTVFEGAFILARATGEADHVRAQLAHLRHDLDLLLGTRDRE